MTSLARLAIMLGALVALGALGAVAEAQPAAESKALAEQLFEQGRGLAKASRWAEACPKFEASYRYDPTLGTQLNLATCYQKVGKLATAWSLFRDASEIAKKAGDAKRRDYARAQAAALEPRLPKLTLTVVKPVPGLVVQRDGTTIDPAALGSPLFVDPGSHEITATAPGYVAYRGSVLSAEGKSETVSIPELEAEPAGSTPPGPAPSEPAPRPATTTAAPAPSRTRTYVGIGAGVAGLAAVGIGLVFGSQASGLLDDAKALCGDDLACADGDFDRGRAMVADARSKATLSTVFVLAGGAALVGGTLLWLTAPSARRTETAFVPVVGADQIGVAAVGRF